MSKIPHDIADLEKPSLEEIKLRHEIVNLRDDNLSPFEKTMKKRVVPVFLPTLTLSATILFFTFNRCDSEKSKAFERYKSEVDLVKMAWEDTNEDTFPHTQKFNRAINYLSEIYTSNKKIYEEDASKIGIDVNKRPIALLMKVIPELKNNARNEKVERSIAEENIPAKKIDVNKAIVVQKPTAARIMKEAAANSNLYSVYIQYNNSSNKGKLQNLIDGLKSKYIIRPTELINDEKKAKFDNEVRYYNIGDSIKARELALQIKLLTGLDFQLKNIRQTAEPSGIFEVWFDNKSLNTPAETVTDIKKPTTDENKYKKVYEGNRYAAIRYFNPINDDIDVSVDDYDEKTNQAKMRINDTEIILLKGKEETKIIDGKYRVTIRVNDYRKNNTSKKVVMYEILVEEKIK